MNILEINLAKRWGGAEINVLHLCRTIKEKGHNIYVAALKGSILSEKAAKAGLTVLPVTYTNQFDVFSIAALLKYIRKYSIEIVNSNISRDSFIAGIAGRLSGVPVVLTKHTNFPIAPHIINQMLYKNLIDRVITVSNATGENILKSIRLERGKIDVVYFGVNIEKYFDQKKFEDWKNSLDVRREFVIGTVCRLDEVKRIDLLIKAAAIAMKTVPGLKACIFGEDEKRILDKLKNYADELGIGDRVVFKGYTEDVKSALYGMDIFIVSSDQEGLGRGAIEAMCAGRPIVSTNVGGLPEVVENGVTGFLVPQGNAEVLAEKISYLLKNPELLKEMGSNAVKTAKDKFSIYTTAEKTVDIYTKTIECRKKQ